jgi:hypothetical protein
MTASRSQPYSMHILGLANSGKKTLFQWIINNPHFNETQRELFMRGTKIITITRRNSIEYLSECLDIKLSKNINTGVNVLMKSNNGYIFCIDSSGHIEEQLAMVASILRSVQDDGEEINSINYSLFFTKMHLLNKDQTLNTTALLAHFIENYPENMNLKDSRPQRVFCANAAIIPKELAIFAANVCCEYLKIFTPQGIPALAQPFEIKDEEKLQAYDGLTAPKRLLPTQLKIINDFNEEFFKLDTTATVNLSHKQIHAVKNSIALLVDKTLAELNKSTFPLEVYEKLFDSIVDSRILAKHNNPRIDKALGINITATQQNILRKIRKTAFEEFEKHLEAKKTDYNYADELHIEICEAQRSPLFAKHLSNKWSIFQPKETKTWNVVEKIRVNHSK